MVGDEGCRRVGEKWDHSGRMKGEGKLICLMDGDWVDGLCDNLVSEGHGQRDAWIIAVRVLGRG
jgi:hypothetical protein